ncbi:unnamed protein product [Cuscuta epithymum]|uniref:RNase H type-1 domain-containing protein n=1 Tax=Cuscuta epithymum TaxID=186058 RepID=A0AAV0EGF3_9ASTE|nr:unnamed protein product [Cuscuta epithymum]
MPAASSSGIPGWFLVNWVRRKEDLAKLIWGCWAIWGERNCRVWQQASSPVCQFMLKAEAFVTGWAQAQTARREGRLAGQRMTASWCCPAAGMVKLNVDAAVRTGYCGLGWCLRDEEGKFVAGAARKWQGNLSVLEAELIGIREALSWLLDFEWRAIEVESDASRAISEILKGSSISSYGLVAADIRDIANNFASISFSHVRRSANKAAHVMAKAACSLSDLQSWFTHPPFLSHM